MGTKTVNSQLSNFKTYIMKRNQCISLAENVFRFGNIPENIDLSYVNRRLLRDGSIAWFYDDVLESLLALPYINLGVFDVYGRPTKIEVRGENSYRRTLKKGEFVIMYDNNSYQSLYLDICQYAERIALCDRVCDINISQQRTPRIWKTSADKVHSMKNLLQDIDSMVDSVMAYEDLDLDDTDCILAPAPYVADKVDMHNEKLWNEFLRVIGVSNLTVQKKERNIRDEVQASQGGTIASRNSRYEPRARAVEEINKKFGTNITLEYYDGEPTTKKETTENEPKENEPKGVENNDISDTNE